METTTRTMIFITILMMLFVINGAANSSKFSAVLVFGDSTVDTGNNNYIPTIMKGDIFPYGKDYAGHIANGRFSNGKLVPDFIANFFGIKESVPPFLDPNLSDDDIRTGVSFASAGTGFDDLTAQVSNVIPIWKQIDMFKKYIERLRGIVGEAEANKTIYNSLVIISAGTNDFAIGYYNLPIKSLSFSVSGYQDFLLGKLQNLLKELYELGCRNIVVAGLPPVGCLPISMSAKLQFFPVRTCLEDQNSDARAYNNKLTSLLPQIQAQLQGSRLFYADIYKPLNELLQNPAKHGFVETKKGCCGTGLVEATFLCNTLTPLCRNPSQYVFFDSIHPSEATYKFMTESLIQDIYSKLIQGRP
ncbi:hypothetical protein ACFE04_016023 [Oxalis oulophora]